MRAAWARRLVAGAELEPYAQTRLLVLGFIAGDLDAQMPAACCWSSAPDRRKERRRRVGLPGQDRRLQLAGV